MGVVWIPLDDLGWLSSYTIGQIRQSRDGNEGVFIQQMFAPEFNLIDGGESGQRNGFRRRIDFVQCSFRSCHKKELITTNVLILLLPR